MSVGTVLRIATGTTGNPYVDIPVMAASMLMSPGTSVLRALPWIGRVVKGLKATDTVADLVRQGRAVVQAGEAALATEKAASKAAKITSGMKGYVTKIKKGADQRIAAAVENATEEASNVAKVTARNRSLEDAMLKAHNDRAEALIRLSHTEQAASELLDEAAKLEAQVGKIPGIRLEVAKANSQAKIMQRAARKQAAKLAKVESRIAKLQRKPGVSQGTARVRPAARVGEDPLAARRAGTDFTEEFVEEAAGTAPVEEAVEQAAAASGEGAPTAAAPSLWGRIRRAAPLVGSGALVGGMAASMASGGESAGAPMSAEPMLAPMDQLKMQGQELRNLMLIKKLMEEAEKNESDLNPQGALPRIF